MLIAITGPPCSGKRAIANYLSSQLFFRTLSVKQTPAYPEVLTQGRSNASTNSEFKSFTELMEYAITNWQERLVVCDVDNPDDIKTARKRPFFLLVAVDANAVTRYGRFAKRFEETSTAEVPKLEEFIIASESYTYGGPGQPNARAAATLSDMLVVNNYTNRSQLHAALDKIDLTTYERLRPSWDTYFMQLANLAARRSNCMKRRVGCILVKDKRIVATGYNGTPYGVQNCYEGGCPRCNQNARCGQSLDICMCLHAEENALLEVGRSGLAGGDLRLYCNTCPCLGCAKKIVQVGVTEVVFTQGYNMDDLTIALFKKVGIRIRRYCPLDVLSQPSDVDKTAVVLTREE